MWIEITRGVAALMSAWSLGSMEPAAETGTTMGADLSGDFLSEAQSYLNMGRHQSAAILAGGALEETLRKLCLNFSIALPARPTVEGMNAQLAKIGVYDTIMKQRLEELQELWEKANSGLWSEVSKSDVEIMLGEVRAFASQHLTN
jgi:HEPN domain-containing protein